jgi:hypothetical protein
VSLSLWNLIAEKHRTAKKKDLGVLGLLIGVQSIMIVTDYDLEIK